MEKSIRGGTNATIYNVHALTKNQEDDDCFFIGQLDGNFSKIKSDFDSCTIQQEFTGHSGAVRDMQLNRTGDKIVSCCADHSLRIWDYARASAERKAGNTIANASLILAGHSDLVSGACFLNADTVVSSSWDQKVMAWKIPKI